MLESNLIVRGRVKPQLPDDTGPGPESLVGWNETAGFFGEVPTTELISGTGLASLIGLAGGTAQNDASPWLKFFIDDKIVFIAKKNYRHTISWDMINAANAVYGDRIIEIKGYQFKVSLIKGLNPDPSVPFAFGLDVPSGYDSEWNRLMYHVASDEGVLEARKKHSQVGSNWANYPQDDSTDGLNISAGNGRYSWCQETVLGQPANRVFRGDYSVSHLNSFTSSTVHAYYGWRPRLELITT